MKILHVGYRYIPFGGGGLIESAEDLMEYQIIKGHEVFYFFAATHSIFRQTPYVKKWRKNGINMIEVVNSPVLHGGDLGHLRPDLDIACEEVEELFKKVLMEIKPDIVHFQEFPKLPTSLIDICYSSDIPTIMTLQDYYLLCPTLKLYDFKEEICKNYNNGLKCYLCCIDGESNNLNHIIRSIEFKFSNKYISYIIKGLFKVYKIYNQRKHIEKTLHNRNLIYHYQKRRLVNIERLKKIDVLVAMSNKVKLIYEKFTHRKDIKVVHFCVKNVERINYKKQENIKYPIKFVTLNGAASKAKGVKLLLDAFHKISMKYENKFELHIFGGLDRTYGKRLIALPNVFYYGPYSRDDLDEILNDYNVGIVPSVWDEAFGFVGIEMLAKGLPLIGNNLGGPPDYIKPGISGWLNYKNNSEGLCEILELIISNPDIIKKLNKNIFLHRRELIPSMESYYKGILDAYKEAINKSGEKK